MFTLLKKFIAFQLLILCLPACGKFDFQGQDLTLRHDAEADTLELELIYKSVCTPNVVTSRKDGTRKAEGIEGVSEAVEGVAAGARYFMVFFRVFEMDLDRTEKDLRELQEEEPNNENIQWLTFLETITVEDATVFLDARGHIGIQQRIRLKGARRATELFNTALHLAVLREVEAGDFERNTDDFFDDATRKRFAAEAKEGTPWGRWDKADFVISLPITSKSSARLLTLLLAEQASEDERSVRAFGAELFGLVEDIQVQPERLVLTLGAGEDGTLRMELEEDERDYDESLLEDLKARGFQFGADPTVGE